MRVFVTGASGFIGSHVCRELIGAGHTVTGLSREAEPWRLADLADRLDLISGALDNQVTWIDRLRAFAPDAIAHLGWSGVGNFDRDNLTQTKNVGWTLDLLEHSAACGCRVFVGIGSQAEYGVDPDPAKSDRPTTMYGEAKLATGRLGMMTAKQLGMRFAWMRVFSVYGPADHPYWMIPSIIRSLLAKKKPALTKGEQKWDFLYVGDAASAIRSVIETAAACGLYPLGSGEAPSLRTTVEMLRDAIDPTQPLGFGEIAYRPDQVMHLQADVSRLRADLGWRAQMPLREGLSLTAQWYQSNSWIFE